MPNIPGGWELIVVVILIMVLFGYKRLPDATRSLGKSMRIFKAETKGLRDDDPHATPTTTTTSASVVEPAPARVDPVRIDPVHTDAGLNGTGAPGSVPVEPVRIVPPEQSEQQQQRPL